ncbi:amidohydrolase [Litorivita sp. NS0012-18]|uniref:amidohydrolase n=1 Tax=Litorivita sp. NS0012-18 TaxID=3127655 RepID=UPI003108D662
MLTDQDITELTDLRRALHRRPEVSGEEKRTARTIALELAKLSPTHLLTGIGGHGVAAVFGSGAGGPCVMFRAELDALPITEIAAHGWPSGAAGKAHLCGHDGHMVMLLGLGRLIARRPPAVGRIVLLFQPAEETGAGARAVVSDPAFAQLDPDWAFAIHNLPGLPLGHVATRAGLINCASEGLEIHLSGKTAHAAQPETGLSPAGAVAQLLGGLTALTAGAPAAGETPDDFELVTLTHARIGAPTFGVAPGEAVINATLRCASDPAMAALEAKARALVQSVASAAGLEAVIRVVEPFLASINHPQAVAIAQDALRALGLSQGESGVPMRASEDFGLFGAHAKAAMLCLGAGEAHPALHNPDYDFPDALIPIGTAIFARIMDDILSRA